MSASPRLVLCDRIVDLAFGLVESRSVPGAVLGRLSPSERAALAALAARPGEIVDRVSLVEAIGRPIAENALERLISRIRSRIEADPASPRHLRTARGIGYRLDFSEAQAEAEPPSIDIVGRREELDYIDTTAAKILVLLGPAGVGKTTLARAWLLKQVGWFVDLSAVRGELEVFRAIAEAMGISGDPLRSIAAKLAPLERAAIVLDNAEQCGEALASALVSLRPVAHSARWIVTSRRPLGVPDEHRLTIGALPLQDATSLWMRRAQAVDPMLPFDEVISVRIVSRLARNPLAIELAAAHLDRMSPLEIARRLEASSGWLSAPSAGREERQVSLPRAIEWSWDLLEDSDREALLAWSLFCWRFSAGDALSIVPGGLSALHRLVDHSLVEILAGPVFLMHAPVREYAQRRLAQHEKADVWRASWRRWCVERASQRTPATLAEVREWLTAFDEDPSAPGAPQLASAILSKGAWLPMERRLALAEGAERASGLLRGELLVARAGLRRYAGLAGFREDLAEALQIAKAHGGKLLLESILLERSHLRRADGDIDGAEEDLLALPVRPNVSYLLGTLYLASCRPQRARAQMLALIASCPSELPEFLWRARMSIAVIDAIVDPQRALAALRALDAELDGGNSHAPVVRCFVRGWSVPILWELGRHSEASELAQQAVRAMRSFGWAVPAVELSAMAAALAPSIERSRAALDAIEAPSAELKRTVAAWRATIESLCGEPELATELELMAAPSPPEPRSQLAAQLRFDALARQIRAGGDLSLLETADVLPPGAEVSLLRAFPAIRALCCDLRARRG